MLTKGYTACYQEGLVCNTLINILFVLYVAKDHISYAPSFKFVYKVENGFIYLHFMCSAVMHVFLVCVSASELID